MTKRRNLLKELNRKETSEPLHAPQNIKGRSFEQAKALSTVLNVSQSVLLYLNFMTCMCASAIQWRPILNVHYILFYQFSNGCSLGHKETIKM